MGPSSTGIHSWDIPTAWGVFRAVLTEAGAVAALALPGQSPSAWTSRGELAGDSPLAAQLAEYIAGRRREFGISLDFGSAAAFSRQVWSETESIPWGRTRSYGDLARRLGSPGAARAVGQALGRNPIPILVPCHRVLQSGGGLGGYSGGLEWKQRLLRHEGACLF